MAANVPVTLATQTPQAQALKEEGNKLAREGKKVDAIQKYERGIRALGFINYQLDEETKKTLAAQDKEYCELLSTLASNAAQMYMDPDVRHLARAIDRCTLALEVNPRNAKAYFRRALSSFDHADSVTAEMADCLLAQAQQDLRRFLQLDETSAAGRSLQEKVNQKRQALLGPITGCQTSKTFPELVPDWFFQVKDQAVFVCLCGVNMESKQKLLPDTLLSLALQATEKRSISVGVAYIESHSTGAELGAFGPEWQRKYYRMLRLGERPVEVPASKRVLVHGQVCDVWSLLEGRVRIMRVDERSASGDKTSVGWARYCAQLLWHGEPFVFQSCCPCLRFAPGWDSSLKSDLTVAQRSSTQRVALSWVSREHNNQPWQWISDEVSNCGTNSITPGVLAAEGFDKQFGWLRFQIRLLRKLPREPLPAAFSTFHTAFSRAEVLQSVPADPFTNLLPVHGQLTCEIVRLHTHGWDTFVPSANFTWRGACTSKECGDPLAGAVEGLPPGEGVEKQCALEEQCARSDALLGRAARTGSADALGAGLGSGEAQPFDEDILDLPVPTPCFWTAGMSEDPSPWETGRQVGFQRFQRGTARTLAAFEHHAGIDLAACEVSKKAKSAGLNGESQFEDSRSSAQSRERAMRGRLGPQALRMCRTAAFA